MEVKNKVTGAHGFVVAPTPNTIARILLTGGYGFAPSSAHWPGEHLKKLHGFTLHVAQQRNNAPAVVDDRPA